MKLSELRKIKNMTENLRSSLDSVSFIKGSGRTITIKHMIKNSHAVSNLDKEAVILVVDTELNNILKSICLKNNKEDPLNSMFDASLNIKDPNNEVSCTIPLIEEKKSSITIDHSVEIENNKNTIKEVLLNMTSSETLSVRGLYFDDWEPETSAYSFVADFTGRTLKHSISENNSFPDKFIERDGFHIICFEEVGYAINRENHSDLIDTLTSSFSSLSEAKLRLSNQLSSFSDYDKAVRASHFFIDDLNELFSSHESLEVIAQKGSDISTLFLTAIEMKEVWDIDNLLSRNDSIFEDLPPFMVKTLKDSLAEIIRSENHIDNYIKESRAFKFRHAANINLDEEESKLNEQVALGVEIYKNGNLIELNRYLKRVNPFVRMGIGLEIHKSKQSEKEVTNVISF